MTSITTDSSNKSNTTFLIVPGAWHVPWHYRLLISSLKSLGYRAECVALPSNHADGPYPETWEDDVDSVASAIRREAAEGNEVVLVMHSYGGLVGSEATKGFLVADHQAKGKKGGVRKLVYMVAMVLPAGEGLPEMVKNILMPEKVEAITNPDPVNGLYNGVSSPLREEAVAKLVPQSAKPLSLILSFEPWKQVPAHYIVSEQDATFPIPMQRAMASLEGGKWSTSSIQTGHSPFLICPDELAAMIVKFATGED